MNGAERRDLQEAGNLLDLAQMRVCEALGVIGLVGRGTPLCNKLEEASRLIAVCDMALERIGKKEKEAL